jgi:hypothetical protein
MSAGRPVEEEDWSGDLVTSVMASLERSRQQHAERERQEQADPRFVITTVHGTWARNASWVLPDSRLGLWLRLQLQPAHIAPFRWSGRNSVKAREEASLALQDHLRAYRARYPNARHAVVAHSHGGNVALAALADRELASGTLGVVTLGTPFLSARTVSPEPLLTYADAIVASIFSGVAIYALGAALGHGHSWLVPGLVALVAIGAMLAAGSKLGRLMERHAERTVDAMPSTALEPRQLAIVRTSADEAQAAISGARVAGASAALF